MNREPSAGSTLSHYRTVSKIGAGADEGGVMNQWQLLGVR